MIGELLDRRYRVTQVLATGGFSQTYLAQDTRIPGEPLCVVKHLKPQTRDSHLIETIHRQFQKEAETLARLGEYHQIPRLLAHFEEDKEFYLVQEFIPGHPLTAELTPGTCWSEARVKAFLLDILVTLSFVHRHGVIHRDVKPANIIRRNTDDKLVLIDFGAVKEITTTAIGERPPTVGVGTPIYMPIEQLKGYPQFSSDLYAVGVVAVQAASGLSINELQSAIDPDYPGKAVRWRDRAQVTPGLENILTRLVQGNYRQRYQTPQEVIADLDALDSQVVFAPATIIAPTSPPVEVRSSSNPPDVLGRDDIPNSPDPAEPATIIDRPASPASIDRSSPPTMIDPVDSPRQSAPPLPPLAQWLEQTKPLPGDAAERRSASVQRGRIYVIAVIAIGLFIMLVNLASFAKSPFTESFRFLLTLALYYFVWRGFGWGRWVLGGLMGLGSLLVFVAIPSFLSQPIVALWLLINGILYAIAAVLMLVVADVKAFQSQQRSQRRKS